MTLDMGALFKIFLKKARFIKIDSFEQQHYQESDLHI